MKLLFALITAAALTGAAALLSESPDVCASCAAPASDTLNGERFCANCARCLLEDAAEDLAELAQ